MELHKKRKTLTEPEVRYYMLQLIDAVHFMHSNNIIHRDLKLGNLFLDDALQVKVGDFGLATTVACLLCIAQFVLLRPWSAALVAPEVLWLSVLNATLCTAVPVLLVMMAIERIGAGLASQAGIIGPMSTILMGAVILGEPFTAWVAAGTVLVIAGIFVFTSNARSGSG